MQWLLSGAPSTECARERRAEHREDAREACGRPARALWPAHLVHLPQEGVALGVLARGVVAVGRHPLLDRLRVEPHLGRARLAQELRDLARLAQRERVQLEHLRSRGAAAVQHAQCSGVSGGRTEHGKRGGARVALLTLLIAHHPPGVALLVVVVLLVVE